MKVVIELLGNESKQDLLATSNYLRELAGEAVPEATERKTDLDKLADAVVEATKVKGEEAPKTVDKIVESERAKTRAKRAAKPAPVEEPAKVEEPAPAPVEEQLVFHCCISAMILQSRRLLISMLLLPL